MSEVAVGISPGRVNLIGEHTDYNDGYVLPIGLGWQARVTATPRDDDAVVVTSAQLGETVRVDDLSPTAGQWWGYVAGALWVLRQRGHAVPGGVEFHLDSQVPLGGGLSSSAAIESAAALAVDDLFRLGLDADELAIVAQAVENDFLGIPTGPMDQRASLWCTAGHALLLDCRTLQGTQVPFALPDDLTLALIDTHSPHVLADGAYGERRASCHAAAEKLGVPALRDVTDLGALDALGDDVLVRRARHVITENARVLDAVAALEASDWARFGALMTASHASMRDDYEITVPTVDQAVESALASGALGARMTGGGFGGTVLALVPADAVDELTRRVGDDYAARGFDAPGVSTTAAEPGGLELRERSRA